MRRVTISVCVTPEQSEALRQMASEEQTTVSAVVRRMLLGFLAKPRAPRRLRVS